MESNVIATLIIDDEGTIKTETIFFDKSDVLYIHSDDYEGTPCTVIKFTNGEIILVKESLEVMKVRCQVLPFLGN
jgi:hypothetical protein